MAGVRGTSVKKRFEQPYFVTPHAVCRFQERVKPVSAERAIQEVQAALQGQEPVERIETLAIYECDHEDTVYYPLVGPGKGEWPAVITIFDETQYNPVTWTWHMMAAKKKPNESWTATEESLLKELYHCCTYKQLARILGRSEKAIDGKVQRLRLSKKRRARRWTKAEDLLMDCFYSPRVVGQIAQLLGRSRRAVKKRAWAKGLTHRKCSPMEKAEVDELVRVALQVCAGIEAGSLRLGPQAQKLVERDGVWGAVIELTHRKAKRERNQWRKAG